jgi:hypothetical protein
MSWIAISGSIVAARAGLVGRAGFFAAHEIDADDEVAELGERAQEALLVGRGQAVLAGDDDHAGTVALLGGLEVGGDADGVQGLAVLLLEPTAFHEEVGHHQPFFAPSSITTAISDSRMPTGNRIQKYVIEFVTRYD